MKRALLVLLVAPLFLAANCERPPIDPPQPAPVGGSAGAPGTGGALSGGSAGSLPATPCEKACSRLAELGCPSAKPTPAGASCSQVCENVNASGTLKLDTDCVLRAGDCATADRCVR